MIIEIIGQNAGVIWHTLNNNGEMQLSGLQKFTKLKTEDFNMAIGWLAREGKIAFYEKEDKLFVFLVF